MQPVVELAGLRVRFGKREILEDLSVALSGRTLGLLGPNGAGKSTLIQTLLGLCPVESLAHASLRGIIWRFRCAVRLTVGGPFFLRNDRSVVAPSFCPYNGKYRTRPSSKRSME